MSAIARIPQPFPYQGSKRLLARHVLRWLPQKFDRLVEPFAGSAAISLAVAAMGAAHRFWLCDANEPLIALWKAIVSAPEALGSRYEALWNQQRGREREFFDLIRDRFNQNHDPADFLYLLARCVKAAVRYNSQGQFNNSPDNRRLGMRPSTMKANLLACSSLLRNRAQITHADYREVLSAVSRNDVIYMDPPYQGVCGSRDLRYSGRMDADGFIDALEDLNRHRVPFIVSYDGRRGNKSFGRDLPESLGLGKWEVEVGPSAQATLLGRSEITFESLYISPALFDRTAGKSAFHSPRAFL